VRLSVSGEHASLALRGLDGVSVSAFGTGLTVVGDKSGTLELAGSHPVGAGDDVVFKAAAALQSVLSIAPRVATLSVPTARMSSVKLGGEELVPTRYAQDEAIVMGTFWTLLTLGVPTLGTALYRRFRYA
jgi:hypothetical protein